MPDRQTIRTHAFAVGLVSWTLLIWAQALPGAFDRFGTLRGVDFLQFYAAGRLVLEGHGANLYDWERFAAMVRAAAPSNATAEYLPVYPPHIALWFAPFAALPYLGALSLWVATSAALYGLSVWLLWRFAPALRPHAVEAVLLAIAFPPLLQLLAHGQAAAPALLLLTLSWFAWRGGYPVLSGIAMGAMLYKPQFALFPGLAVALLGGTRVPMAAGVAAAVAVQAAVIGVVLGPDLPLEYVRSLMRAASMADVFEPKPWQMHGLNGAVVLLLGRSLFSKLTSAALSLGVFCLAWRAVRRTEGREVRFAIVGLSAILLNPHVYVYDLVLLGVPLALLASRLVRSAGGDGAPLGVALLAYGLVWLPLLGPLAQVTRVQLTAPALAALIWLLGRAGPKPSTSRL